MRSCLRCFLALIVALSVLSAKAGSYEDFFAAVKRDDEQAVQALLQRGFDPNAQSPDGQYGLYLALREPALKVARVLIDWPKTAVESRNKADESPLMMAALKGQTDMVKRLIARDADVNKPGWTPLHYAATGGQLEIMGLLLENYAFIDAQSPNGTTPLMMAAMYASPQAVKLLLDAGADTGLKNQLGMTAWDFAMRAQRPDAAEMISRHIRSRQRPGSW